MMIDLKVENSGRKLRQPLPEAFVEAHCRELGVPVLSFEVEIDLNQLFRCPQIQSEAEFIVSATPNTQGVYRDE